MLKQWLVILIILSSFIFSGCLAVEKNSSDIPTASQNATIPSSQQSIIPNSVPTDFTARFEIITNGTRRIFTDAKYHHQSTDIYIESSDPQLIHIKKSGLTWGDFFNTLPFSLKKDCLVTGTKQTFCNTETRKLYFYLNDQEDFDALDKIIGPNDSLRVEYKLS